MSWIHLFIPRRLTLNIDFDTIRKSIEFDEPTIYNTIQFYSYIQKEKYIKGISCIIPDIDEKICHMNINGVINWIIQLLSQSEEKSNEETNFASIIDLLAHRYGTNPIELMQKMTLSQMTACIEGYTWNLNIENWKEKDNLLQWWDLEEDLKKARRIKERHSKIHQQ